MFSGLTWIQKIFLLIFVLPVFILLADIYFDPELVVVALYARAINWFVTLLGLPVNQEVFPLYLSVWPAICVLGFFLLWAPQMFATVTGIPRLARDVRRTTKEGSTWLKVGVVAWSILGLVVFAASVWWASVQLPLLFNS